MKKFFALTCLLLVCSLSCADSLERFINKYKEKEGVVCRVLNRDYHFNDVADDDMSPEAQRLVSGAMALMGVEEAVENMFKGFKSKHIKVKTAPVKRVDRDIVCKNKDYDMHEVVVECCNKKMALNTGDIAAGFYCAYCGRIVK